MRKEDIMFRMFVLFSLMLAAHGLSGAVVHAAPLKPECRAAILTYHQIEPLPADADDDDRLYTIEPEVFAKQMLYLRDNAYAVVSYDDVVACVTRGKALPAKAVVITFDDSVLSPYVHALPVLKRYRYTATFFITTDFVGTGAHLTWDQVAELRDLGMTIGAHSRRHPHMTALFDPERLDDETRRAGDILRVHLGARTTYFAYPFGEFDERSLVGVRAAGYVASRGTDRGVLHVRSELFAMRSYVCTSDVSTFHDALKALR